MTAAIIGAGFTGLASGYKLTKHGYRVTVFEKASASGGLASGFKKRLWDWSLEEHYHHWFINDSTVLNLAKELNIPYIVKRPKTSVYTDNKLFQFDSPSSVLTFPKLSLVDRLRMAAVVGSLRYNPFWRIYESNTACNYLKTWMGKRGYELIWHPLMVGKFGDYANDISLAWFWARVKKRTPSLAYPVGGYASLAEKLTKEIEKRGGSVQLNTAVTSITLRRDKEIQITVGKNEKLAFDKAIVTTPTSVFTSIALGLSESYKNKLSELKGLGAINLVLRLKKPFLPDNTYWLNICDESIPFTALIEHTNFMDKKYYNKEHIVYVGNYLPKAHEFFSLSSEKLLSRFDPYLKKLNKDYKKHLIGVDVFKAPFAQPIVSVGYEKLIPPIRTPLPNVYLASMQQVYPWDRGTNYAVELGIKTANVILSTNSKRQEDAIE